MKIASDLRRNPKRKRKAPKPMATWMGALGAIGA
jgi:hypothetical protein